MTTQALLTRWFEDAAAPREPRVPKLDPTPRLVVCLAGRDEGAALRPWLRRGYRSLGDKIRKHPTRVAVTLAAHRGRVGFACAFPLCVDLASAGARWWRRKRAENPDFQTDAVERLRETERLLQSTGAPYCLFTPGSATIARLWKAPSATISPYQYGGYLPEDHTHPGMPDVVPGRDRYHKRTYVYTGNGFVLPRRKPVEPVWVTRRDRKTGRLQRLSPVLARRKHKHARRLAPLGFLEAVAGIHARVLSL